MNNIYGFKGKINKSDREELLSQKGVVIWLCGLSGSGKSTIADLIQKDLHELGKLTYLLDGDNIRSGINNDLSFSLIDRKENIRSVAHIAKLMADMGAVVLVSFITPTVDSRKMAKSIVGKDYHLIFIDAGIDECIKRDTKGLYKKALAGEIDDFTGITSPFEEPIDFELHLITNETNEVTCSETLLSYILLIIEEK